MMEQRKKSLRLWVCLLVVNLVIIWGNSMLPGEISGAISDNVKDFLTQFLPAGPKDSPGGGGLIRKLGHFTEFTCLGVCLSMLFRILRTRKAEWIYLPLVCGVTAASIDETIQRFVPDRGPSIFDVGIDTLGVITGIVIITLIQKRKKKTINYMEETNQ